MKFPKPTLSILTLTAANLVPLGGVLLLGWDAAVIVLVYWTENVVIGFYNILRMALVKVKHPTFHLGKLLAIPFFCLHFGGFCGLHGIFLLFLFKLGGGPRFLFPENTWPGHLVFMQLLVLAVTRLWQSHPPGMQWPVIALVVSHGVSFFQNYLFGKEYARLSMKKLMNRPYKRIVILHLAIIAGGLPIMLLGSPVPLLLILVALKIGIDIRLHIKSHSAVSPGTGKEHRRREAQPASAADP